MLEKIRHTIASIAERKLRLCWMTLVPWVVGIETLRELLEDREALSDRECRPGGRNNVADWGGCYCGKHSCEEANDV